MPRILKMEKNCFRLIRIVRIYTPGLKAYRKTTAKFTINRMIVWMAVRNWHRHHENHFTCISLYFAVVGRSYGYFHCGTIYMICIHFPCKEHASTFMYLFARPSAIILISIVNFLLFAFRCIKRFFLYRFVGITYSLIVLCNCIVLCWMANVLLDLILFVLDSLSLLLFFSRPSYHDFVVCFVGHTSAAFFSYSFFILWIFVVVDVVNQIFFCLKNWWKFEQSLKINYWMFQLSFSFHSALSLLGMDFISSKILAY